MIIIQCKTCNKGIGVSPHNFSNMVIFCMDCENNGVGEE